MKGVNDSLRSIKKKGVAFRPSVWDYATFKNTVILPYSYAKIIYELMTVVSIPKRTIKRKEMLAVGKLDAVIGDIFTKFSNE